MRLRFWFRSSLQTLAATLGASAVYGLLMGIQLDGASFQDVLSLLPMYLMLFGAVMLMAMMLAVYKFSLGLSISLGSTRREAFVGLQVYRLVPTLVTVAVTALVTLVPGVETFWGPAVMIPAALGIFLFTGALGGLAGMVYLRFGKIAAILTVLLLIVMGGVCGGLTVFFAEANWPVLAGWIPWLILGLGAVVYGLVLIPESRVVRKYQVKL